MDQTATVVPMESHPLSMGQNAPRKAQVAKQPQQQQQTTKQIMKWDPPFRKNFIQFWQSFFNRRICAFWSFSLQIGDVFILLLGLAYIAYCCLITTKEKDSGASAQIMLGLTVIFGCRNGVLSWLFGLSLERAILWHQYFAWLALASGINHWSCSSDLIDGYFVLIVLALMVVFSIMPIRRYLWELFIKVHWILIVLLFIASIMHSVSFGIITLIYFALDVVLRIYISLKYRECSFSTKLEQIGSNIVKITAPKGRIHYEGGQYFFIMIPSITVFQWHPFSVVSASYEDQITFYVKVLGDWTEDLYIHAGKEGQPKEVKAYFDGPYGLHSVSISKEKYKSFLCLSGGIGVTPILSTAKELLNQQRLRERNIDNLIFIWTGRDIDIVKKVLKASDLKNALGGNDEKKIVEEYYHLTGEEKKKTKQVDIEQPSYQNEEVQPLNGRPKLEKYFEDAYKKAKAKGENLVAVLACGPQALIDSAEKLGSKWSRDGIRFDVHQEVFNF